MEIGKGGRINGWVGWEGSECCSQGHNGGENPLTIRRPIQRLFPLEFNEQEQLNQEHSDLLVAVPEGGFDQAQNQGDNVEKETTGEGDYNRDTTKKPSICPC